MIKALLAVITCTVMTGCAYRPMVSIDAISGSNATQDKSYILTDGNKNPSPLEFEQYAAQVNRTLQELGFTKAADQSTPDFIATLTTTVGAKYTTTRTEVAPTYGVTGAVTRSSGSISDNRYQGTSTSTPTYGITGSRHYEVTEAYYPIGFSLAAYRTDEKKTPIWQITVTAPSITPDLRRHFGTLLQTAAPYIGKDTKGLIQVRAHAQD